VLSLLSSICGHSIQCHMGLYMPQVCDICVCMFRVRTFRWQSSYSDVEVIKLRRMSYAIKALEALFVTLLGGHWDGCRHDTFNGLHVCAYPCAGLNDVIAGDVATDDAGTDDAATDTGDGEPPQSLNAENAGAMPYAPYASI
jgi:hypothetical protein